ncbi:ryncolin-1-like [Haliotis asinina]|uniref:ryncolin-1-like n=1 Tax=Haliotis asinina TaxID=109174 RepID=UPI00353252C4
MVFDYVQAASSLQCATTCHGGVNCTGFIYCSINNRCSILTSDKPSGPVSVPYPTCKAFSNVTTSRQTSPSCLNGGTPDGAVCLCTPAFTGGNCETRMEDCTDVYLYVGNSTGTYTVWPTKAARPFDLECDNVTVKIMFRDRTISGCEAEIVTYLDVPWVDYKYGFTHSNCYMWLGLEKMHALTSVRPNKLFIFVTANITSGQVSYSAFSVGNESSEYRLSVSGFTGDGVFGDLFNLKDPVRTLDGSHFCAKDRCANNPCAVFYGGAWWSRLDACLSNPHYSLGVNFCPPCDDNHECKSIYMLIGPA